MPTPDPAGPAPNQFGSLKPMCMGCFRRVYGMAKAGGWWCSNCEDWIVKPKKTKRGTK